VRGNVGDVLEINLAPNDQQNYWTVSGVSGNIAIDRDLLKTKSVLSIKIVDANTDAVLVLSGKGGESSIIAVRT
jgi:hypothetical protein